MLDKLEFYFKAQATNIGNVSKIIKKTCEEFDVKYIEFRRMRDAVFSHTMHLKKMGNA
jgi:hypothetical protein